MDVPADPDPQLQDPADPKALNFFMIQQHSLYSNYLEFYYFARLESDQEKNHDSVLMVMVIVRVKILVMVMVNSPFFP